MTPIRPTLVLQRLVILKSGSFLYDQLFHMGLNIIRGENSSGKSTIADFIFYALGGDLKHWTPEASSADSVHAQVALNGKTYTLSREIQSNSRLPLYIYGGEFDSAIAARDEWLRYPYNRTSNTESFSQVIFDLLGLPEQKTEAQQNITLNQILRLLYLDQITSVDEIFRHEQFDNRDIRTAVGELLLGIDDLEMHDIRLRLRETERNFSEVSGEIQSMFRVLGQSDHANISVVDYKKQISDAQIEQENILGIVDELATRRAEDVSREVDERISHVYDTLRTTKENMAEQHRAEQSIALDLEDSRNFLNTLDERLRSLSASEHMISILGSAQFKICPACFQMTEGIEADSVCHLCKNPTSETEAGAGHLKMREELTFQMRESTRLIDSRQAKLTSIRQSLSNLAREKRNCEAQLSSFVRSAHAVDAEIETQMQKMGYLDRLIEDLISREQLAELIGKRMSFRDELNQKISELSGLLEAHTLARDKRANEIDSKVSDLCVEILHRDLPHEESFQDAEVVEFDFSKNRILADGRARFSASSMTFLKNALFFSMMRLSLEDQQIRWPRFLLLDNIEDKGMQPTRSANFQELVAETLANVGVDHQVIMTTSMISQKLNDSSLCVGPFYAHDNKTLGFSQKKSL